MSVQVTSRCHVLSGGALRRFLFGFSSLALFIIAFAFLASPPAFAVTNISGGTVISQNTEWTTAGSPYVIQGFSYGSSVTVASGVTLTVDSGVVVKFDSSNGSLNVNGALSATGAVFTSYKDDAHGGDTNGDGGQPCPRLVTGKAFTWDRQALPLPPRNNLQQYLFWK